MLCKKLKKYTPYPPFIGRYPSNPKSPYGMEALPKRLGQECTHSCPGEDTSSLKKCVLTPAFVGIGLSLLISLGPKSQKLDKTSGWQAFTMLAVNAFTAVASIGVALYIFIELTDNGEDLVRTLVPIGIAVITLITLFGSVFTMVYRLFPDSFKGEVGDDFLTQFLSFIYLSVTTFATASVGDIMPATIGTRMLISTEVLFFIFIFTMGIALFVK